MNPFAVIKYSHFQNISKTIDSRRKTITELKFATAKTHLLRCKGLPSFVNLPYQPVFLDLSVFLSNSQATPLLNQVTMKNVSELLRLGLVDMKDANSVVSFIPVSL